MGNEELMANSDWLPVFKRLGEKGEANSERLWRISLSLQERGRVRSARVEIWILQSLRFLRMTT